MILFRLAFRRFSTEAYTSTLRCFSGRNRAKFYGTHNETKKQPPTERLHFTCGQLQLLTNNYRPQNWGTLLMRCMRASGAPDSSRRQPETTQEVFSWTRSCDPAAQKTPKIAKLFHFTRGSLVRWLHHIWKTIFTKRMLFSRRMILSILGTYPKPVRKRKLCSRESLYVIAPKKEKKTGTYTLKEYW